ncbi:MAG: TetR/AcrR family transcriptional regulator, partial [Pseudoprimorskyibacter sp.]|nr:TetR/AcrR family transcriptional regulator [Pseudoprimorskyibacter sp.]
QWISDGPFRKDQPALLLAEGVQAFVVQSMALNFCAINSDTSLQSRLLLYLDAWLGPQTV